MPLTPPPPGPPVLLVTIVTPTSSSKFVLEELSSSISLSFPTGPPKSVFPIASPTAAPTLCPKSSNVFPFLTPDEDCTDGSGLLVECSRPPPINSVILATSRAPSHFNFVSSFNCFLGFSASRILLYNCFRELALGRVVLLLVPEEELLPRGPALWLRGWWCRVEEVSPPVNVENRFDDVDKVSETTDENDFGQGEEDLEDVWNAFSSLIGWKQKHKKSSRRRVL